MEDNESTTTAADHQLGELPGFRFHPTEEELLEFYLKNIILGKKLHYDIIAFLNIYHHDPWELPGTLPKFYIHIIFVCFFFP